MPSSVGMGRERNLLVDKRLTDFTPVTNIKGEVQCEEVRRMTLMSGHGFKVFLMTLR